MTEVELHIHIKKDGNLLVTPERMKLLRLIHSSGSLLTASKKLGISYNKAWKMLDAINKAVKEPIVIKTRGGAGGGGAVITEYGHFVLSEYALIEKEISKYVKKLNTELNM